MKRFWSSNPKPSIFWTSPIAPKVHTDKTCVSPLVNKAEPWTLGNKSTWAFNGRTSSILRPSGLIFSSVIKRLTSFFSKSCKMIPTCFITDSFVSSSAYSFSSYCAVTRSMISSIAAYLSSFPGIDTAATISSLHKSVISWTKASSNSNNGISIFSLPHASTTFSSKAINSLIASCPNIKAFNIVSSSTSLASASTILIASFVPATSKLIKLLSISSGPALIVNSPSIKPTLTPAIGPLKGISETHNAREAPNIAAISGEACWSTDKTVLTTCTSFLNPSANNGRIGLSIILAVKVPCSLGRPSLFRNPPGILPTEYNFSSYVTVSGKKSTLFGSFPATAVDKMTVSSYLTKTLPLACLANSPTSTVRFFP